MAQNVKPTDAPGPTAEAAPAEAAAESGKKAKMPKLTKAEKKALQILEAMNLKKRMIRDQLEREIALCKKSVKRGKPLWEGLCAEVKLKEFREEIEQWGEYTEKLMEKKDEKIDVLMKTIRETQELHERNFSQHLEELNYLTECHKSFQETAAVLYETETANLIEDFFAELSRKSLNQERNKLFNENAMHASNIVAKSKLRKNYEKYMESKFREVSILMEQRYLLRDATTKRMRLLQDQLLLWIKALQGDMLDVHKTARFLYFMDRQRNYVQESTRLNETEKLSIRTINDLQKELLNIESESARKIHGLKLEQAYFQDVRGIIKGSIERDKQVTHDKLLVVSSESYTVLKKLNKIVKFGELLLSVGACCRKHQTEREKVVPWTIDSSQITAETVAAFKMEFDIVKHLDLSEEELTEQMRLLNNFWLRCSNASLHILLLKEEMRKLNEENERYQNVIRSLSKSDDVEYILEAMGIKQLMTYYALCFISLFPTIF